MIPFNKTDRLIFVNIKNSFEAMVKNASIAQGLIPYDAAFSLKLV